LPKSRLKGPQVCLAATQWAELAAQGRDITTEALVFEKSAGLRPQACIRVGSPGASTGFYSMVRYECF
jgi:hypothetical protein